MIDDNLSRSEQSAGDHVREQDKSHIHLLVRLKVAVGVPAVYIAICGYESSTKEEFSVEGVKTTCEHCLGIMRWPR